MTRSSSRSTSGPADVKWKTERRKPCDQAYTTPLVIPVDGRDQVVSVGAYRAAAYDPETGREIWRVSYEDGFSNVPRPVFGARPGVHCDGIPAAHASRRPAGRRGDVTNTHVAWTADPRRALHAVADRRRR